MLWEVEIRPAPGQVDREAARVEAECREWGIGSVTQVETARSFLIEGELQIDAVRRAAASLLADSVAETHDVRRIDAEGNGTTGQDEWRLVNVLFKPGVTDNVAQSTKTALAETGLTVNGVATCRKYWFNASADTSDLQRLAAKVLANDAVEQVIQGPLQLASLAVGSEYEFQLITIPLRGMGEDELLRLSRDGQLFLNTVEMQSIQRYYMELDRDPTDIELETLAQTWSEHCSHKTLAGRISYRDEHGERSFENMLKETIFAATETIRKRLGDDDWCVSVFEDNAGIVTFDERNNVCIKVETHNHPSALEPYGGANTGLGGVIRDPLGTGLGARPVCNTDVFCFAPPDTSHEDLPPGTLHPQVVARGVVAGVRDYGNRMGIPTVNGAVLFDERYLGNPLVFCGNVAMIPVDKCEKDLSPGDLIVAVGGRTGRDGIHGATFSSAELTHESESLSGGAVQIGDAVTEKMLADVVLQARDRNLYSAITDCGAGGFSSAVGEMGEQTGAEVWLERAPLKYDGLSYTEVWISEAQERMVLAVPPASADELLQLCGSEGVEATVIGKFTDTGRLVLKYRDQQVGDLSMQFMHKGRPPVVRDAVYEPIVDAPQDSLPAREQFDDDLKSILGSLNVCSKEWIIRQYDHEVQAGSVIKPLVGLECDGPSDAAVVRPDLTSNRGLIVGCGINPHYGDLDPYWMAASAIDEAVRNCIAVGADPRRICILDNFCWGNTERPEVLGSLVRAALACQDVATAFSTPFVSGKDSLNNEFSYEDSDGNRHTVAIPPSLLITALGQIDDVSTAVTMDLKEAGNRLYLVGPTHDELGGSHFAAINGLQGGQVPHVDLQNAPRLFEAVHAAISQGWVRSCHDLSEGGLAVAAAEMSFAGGLGLELSLTELAKSSGINEPAVLLFSESNTRFLMEVPFEHASNFEHEFAHLPFAFLGKVVDGERVRIESTDGVAVIDSPWRELKNAWKAPLAWD